MKHRVGITGHDGFIGRHLVNHLKLHQNEIELVPFRRDTFASPDLLKQFISSCDVIVHLAALNRGEPATVYEVNVGLVRQLVGALESAQLRPHVLFSSSTQEDRDSEYGKSKRDGRQIFEDWAKRTGARISGFIIPNVFGPFGRPFYNSFVPTFCHQLTHGEEPEIKVDASITFVYVNDLVVCMYDAIADGGKRGSPILVKATGEGKVSEILARLKEFRKTYCDEHVIPELRDGFDVALFNTFRSYIDPSSFQVALQKRSDERGYLVEAVKAYTHGQTFFSVTKPGVARGNHFHTRKIERFCVIRGEATIKLRRIGTSEILTYRVSGENPSFIDMPVFYTHNITNTGSGELETLFWSNEIFDAADPDTYFEEVG